MSWVGNEYPYGKHVIWTQKRMSDWVAGSTPPLPKGAGPIVAPTEQQAIAGVRNVIETMHPNYFGMAQAITRFRRHKPDAFQGPDYTGPVGERLTKIEASTRINAILTANDADIGALADENLPLAGLKRFKTDFRRAGMTNPLMPSWQEFNDLATVIESGQGRNFIEAAASFTNGHYASGLQGMKTAMGSKRFTWPIASYLPFLWRPEYHMFLKPQITTDYAERVGHPFWIEYKQGITAEVYTSLLDLVAHTRQTLIANKLAPTDNIDIQSFIWVVGAYMDEPKK